MNAIDWDKTLTDARDLVAKGYSVETPRWKIRDHLREKMREAYAAERTDIADQFMWLIDEWNHKD